VGPEKFRRARLEKHAIVRSTRFAVSAVEERCFHVFCAT